MDMSFTLWVGGMLFTLGVFATKVGLGLAYGGAKRRVVLLTHLVYFLLFVTAAVSCEPLVKTIKPILQSGPHIHALIAIVLLFWGIHLLRTGKTTRSQEVSAHSLALLIPCPVCFSAVVFSTWTALQITDMAPILVGAGLGISFVLMASILHLSVYWRRSESDPRASSVALGCVMLAIGGYFLASLVIPGQIHKARSVYATFNANNEQIGNEAGGTGVLILLLAVVIAGYVVRLKETSE